MSTESRIMLFKRLASLLLVGSFLIVSNCRKEASERENNSFSSLKEVPAVRLNYRYEPDVPAPTDNKKVSGDERNASVQSDFDQYRPQELVDKTIASPDSKRVLVVYHKVTDLPAEFRLDMYGPDGKILRKITPDTMAVHFPDSILWSPDSTTVAFVAMLRGAQSEPTDALLSDSDVAASPLPNATTGAPSPETNTNTTAEQPDANIERNINAAPPVPTPEPPVGVLTFRTEQIYIVNADGDGVKPITQNEGLIYFYYVWSPDSSMLASLATTFQEWNYLQYQAEGKKEVFVPMGRPRLIEKNGRERRLDDNLTSVHPVWSPDSAKIADAFNTQIRIYDAIGDVPTQAAIPLRNQLLISSKAFEDQLRKEEQSGNANVNSETNAQPNANADINANQTANAAPNQPIGTLPDEASLVSFNPIINLEWTQDDMLYFQTGYIKQMINEADSARSYLRWHRLIFSPQAVALQ